MRFLSLAPLAVAFSLSLPAQITSLSSTSIGAFCNMGSTGCCAVPSQPTALVPSLDVSNQRVLFDVNALEGCCGVAVPLRALALGTQQALVPLPELGGTCALHLVPVVLVAAASNPFVLQLPPGLGSFTFLAQGAALITDPWGPGVATLTDGLAITLQ
jgi:hypothetical protein